MNDAVHEHAVEDLLGPLNDFERRNAPKRLFASGDTGLLRSSARVAIVGSRKATTAGLKRASRLAHELVAANVLVVSGMAKGIDTAAHCATIEGGGRTIAVLGTPLDQCFPKSNAALQEQIAREHLVLSQFPRASPIDRRNFPLRNRLMALVADATVIVEAREGSGTMHQAWEALRLGRPLFLMRSILDDETLTWPSKVLEYGATLLGDTSQVLEVLPTQRPFTFEDAPF